MKSHMADEFTLPREALSPDGFIVNQSALNAIPNGFRNSDYNGCGWIAVYNALHAAGRCPSAPAVHAALQKGLFLYGLWGTNPFSLRRYFKRLGFSVRTSLRKSAMAQNAAEASVSILFYFHRHGAHYITLVPEQSGLFRVLNQFCTPNDIRTLEQIFSTFRFGMLFTLRLHK